MGSGASERAPRKQSRKAPELIFFRFWNPLLDVSYKFFPGPQGPHIQRCHAMPLYFFRIRSGRYSGACDYGTELADRNEAWKELTSVCGDLVGGISRKLQENSEWQMELLDESKRPVFRIRLVAESLD
ncbi:MAG: hypothetical protein QOC84_2600 [Bradyrhizobium sp.]|nr:hypothetical protein [Bradyrhizobium sp.]